MRLLIDQGGYLFANLGDWAMLQVTLRRMRRLFPDAQLYVMTRTADLLLPHEPDVHPLTTVGRKKAIGSEATLPLLGRVLPGLEWRVQRGMLGLSGALAGLWTLPKPQVRRQAKDYLASLRGCDAVISSGGGFLSDEFPRHTEELCRELCLAQDLGKPTALFGVGLGPLESPDLLRWCSRALPRLDFVSLREDIASPAILRQFGVPDTKFCVTGDDAIDVAYEQRADALGSGVGVNLRLNQHSQLSVSTLGRLTGHIVQFAKDRQTQLVPCPIAFFPKYNDAQALLESFGPNHGIGDGGRKIHTPQDVLRQITFCRIMVTGSYHPAVFAMSQGIPTILLGRSPYYLTKHRGLTAQFGEGGRVIAVGEDGWEQELTRTLDEFWVRAEELRPKLLAQAQRQIALSEAAYERFAAMLRARLPQSSAGASASA